MCTTKNEFAMRQKKFTTKNEFVVRFFFTVCPIKNAWRTGKEPFAVRVIKYAHQNFGRMAK
jgi:hypothetical protein